MIIVANTAFCQYSSGIRPLYTPNYIVDEVFSGHQILTGISLKEVVPANFYANRLGFFCKKEWKFESATGVPLKFRIGSVSQCDWLEGKKNSGLQPFNP